MATIRPRITSTGQRRYQVQVRLRGYPPQTRTFRRKTNAKRWAQKVETRIHEGTFSPALESRRRTLADLTDRYIRVVLPTRSKGRKKLAMLLDRWREELGAYFLTEVTPARIADVRDRLRAEITRFGVPRSPSTVNRYLAALSHAFTIAQQEWGWVLFNPVRRVRRLREPRGRVRFLSDDERSRLLAACKASREERLYPLVLLALSTGARVGELLSLRWRDVDLVRGIGVLHHTKNRERRAIALTGKALEVLQKRVNLKKSDDDRVLASALGKATFPQKPWQEALRVAQIDDFRFHDLRHSAASYLAMSGATVAEIAEVLGHKTLQMVKRYSHLTMSHTRAVVARMNAAFLDDDTGEA